MSQFKTWERCLKCHSIFTFVDYKKFLTFQPQRKELEKFKGTWLQQNSFKQYKNQLSQSLTFIQGSSPSFKLESSILNLNQSQASFASLKRGPHPSLKQQNAIAADQDTDLPSHQEQKQTKDFPQTRCNCEEIIHRIDPHFIQCVKKFQKLVKWPRCACGSFLSPKQISSACQLRQWQVQYFYKAIYLEQFQVQNQNCKHKRVSSKIILKKIDDFILKSGAISSTNWPMCDKCKALYSPQVINKIFPWIKIQHLTIQFQEVQQSSFTTPQQKKAEQNLGMDDQQEQKSQLINPTKLKRNKMVKSIHKLSIFNQNDSNCSCERKIREQDLIQKINSLEQLENFSSFDTLWPKCSNCKVKLTPNDICKQAPSLKQDEIQTLFFNYLKKSNPCKNQICGHYLELFALYKHLFEESNKGGRLYDWPKCLKCIRSIDPDLISKIFVWKESYQFKNTYRQINKGEQTKTENQSIQLSCGHSISTQAMHSNWKRLFKGWEEEKQNLFKDYPEKKLKLRPFCLQCLTPLSATQIAQFSGDHFQQKQLSLLLNQNRNLIPCSCLQPKCQTKFMSFDQDDKARYFSLQRHSHAGCAVPQIQIMSGQCRCIYCNDFKYNEQNVFIVSKNKKFHKNCFLEQLLELFQKHQQKLYFKSKIGLELFLLQQEDIGIFLMDALGLPSSKERRAAILKNPLVRKFAKQELKLTL